MHHNAIRVHRMLLATILFASPAIATPAIVKVGNVIFTPSNTLIMEIGGLLPGSQHDQIQASGVASLNGTLQLDLINGFVPQSGDQFRIITAASRIGAFATVTGATPAPGLGLHAISTPTDVTVLAAGPSLSFQIENSARLILSADQDLHELTLESSTAQLDLNSHFLRIHSSDLPAAKSDLYSLIRGGQIYDSALAAHPNSAIGLAITGNAILIRPTRIGDLNLDGIVSIGDFIELASHFNQPGTWQEGDINYDGQVTIADFIDLASNFNQSYSGESLPILPQDQQMLSSFAASIGASSSVPEPTFACCLLGLVTSLQLRRRYR